MRHFSMSSKVDTQTLMFHVVKVNPDHKTLTVGIELLCTTWEAKAE
jgi:hypothetical protein